MNDAYDPLYKLMRAEQSLIVAGARGEEVKHKLQEVRQAIRDIVESRTAAAEHELDGGRSRGR